MEELKSYNPRWKWNSENPSSPCATCPVRRQCDSPNELEIGMNCREYLEFTEHMGVIDFHALLALVQEGESITGVIEFLCMNDIPMSAPVIRLGIAMGILGPEYDNGWSK